MAKLFKYTLFLGGLIGVIPAAHAQVSIEMPQDFAGFSTQPLPVIIGNLVGVLLNFLGLFLIVAIIYGGLLWMISGGNEDKVAKAKGVIGASIAGLVLVMMSYSIATFVVSSIAQAV